jgi:hypothetical protein
MMDNKKILIIIVVVGISFGIIGYLLAPKGTNIDSEVKKERDADIKQSEKIQITQDSLKSLSDQFAKIRYKDSIFYNTEIQRKEAVILGLKRRLDEINFKNYTVHELDSIRRDLVRSAKKE